MNKDQESLINTGAWTAIWAFSFISYYMGKSGFWPWIVVLSIASGHAVFSSLWDMRKGARR